MLLRALLLAFSMLTRLPLHPRGEVGARELRASVAFYPVVGLALGALLALLAPWLSRVSIAGAGGLVLTALLSAVTGALHLDGLADWFDAVGGGRGDRARMLDIMKDSRIGAHGATALVLVLGGKCVLFDAALPIFSSLQWLCVPALSRAAIIPLIAFMRPARPEGLAHAVHGGRALMLLAPTIAVLSALCALGGAAAIGIAAGSAFAAAAAIGVWAQRRIAGVTGDVLGAALELAELTACIALLATR